MNDNVIQQLWDGFVPIQLNILSEEIATVTRPNVYYRLVSRFSYLPVVAAEAIDHFMDSALEYTSDIWFESNMTPLKR